MPITNMGIGKIGNEDIVFKRKFRWKLFITDSAVPGVTGEMWYARVASRPTLQFEDTPIYHLHETHHITGKPTWPTIDLTIYDVKLDGEIGGSSASEAILQNWLNAQWKFNKGASNSYQFLDMGDHDREYKADLTLYMLDGHGDVMETWFLLGAYAQNVNWGDLDYATSDTADVTVTVQFDRAEYLSGNGGTASGGAPGV